MASNWGIRIYFYDIFFLSYTFGIYIYIYAKIAPPRLTTYNSSGLSYTSFTQKANLKSRIVCDCNPADYDYEITCI